MGAGKWVWGAAAALLLILVCEIALSTRQVSASWDEGDHIFSGYMSWKHREYSLNPEHPPPVHQAAWRRSQDTSSSSAHSIISCLRATFTAWWTSSESLR